MRDQKKFSCIIRLPDTPGALHQAIGLIRKHGGNINRIQFDRRIDPGTVFFEITAPGQEYASIAGELAERGYLRTSAKPGSLLRLSVSLPHEPGALFGFLNTTTASRANITAIDFDDTGSHPERLLVSLNLDEGTGAEDLIRELRSRYPIEVLEYDTTGRHLDDTVFYLRFAQEVRNLIGDSEEPFLLELLGDINHIVQELQGLSKDPKKVFGSILSTGTEIARTDREFSADVQRIVLGPGHELFCFQFPCGGNVYIIATPEERVMIDTGYGIYYPHLLGLLGHYVGCGRDGISRILITHGDADHCGAAGFFSAPSLLTRGTEGVIREANRAFGSPGERSVLEAVYTRLINIFSKYTPPGEYSLFPGASGGREGVFPILDRIRVGDLTLEVLDGLGGHLHGQVYFLCREAGLLFSADALINLEHLTKERAAYNSLAVYLVTSVNVNPAVAKEERAALSRIAADHPLVNGRPCLVCGGHGPISVFSGKKLVPYGGIEHYCEE